MSLIPKPTVRYTRTLYPPKVGGPVFVFPVDHPNLSNTRPAWTSTVVSVGEAGRFETRNTIYVLEAAC